MRATLAYLNAAHFLDHYFLLIFPTAVLAIHPVWGMGYGEALALAIPGLVAFALATPVAGWLGDHYGERPLMMAFFLGIGLASMATGLAAGPVTLAAGLTAIGVFASIYHPVGTAFLVRTTERTGAALGVNGVFGNLGVAAAAGITGLIAASFGWRAAFIIPGAVALVVGIAFILRSADVPGSRPGNPPSHWSPAARVDRTKVLAFVAASALFGGLVFNGVTIALPKLFEERLAGATNLGEVGLYASLVFAIGAFVQIPVGIALDRIGARPVIIAMTSLQAVLFIVVAHSDGVMAVIVAIPLMAAVFGEIPVSAWLVGRYVVPRFRARAYSIEYLLALGVSAAVVPLISVLHSRTGSQTALLLVLSGCITMVLLAALLLLPGGRRGMPGAGDRQDHQATANRDC